MITKFWYSVGNGGDGSAYPQFFESEALAEWHQDNLTEGWGESCVSYFEVEHKGAIKGLGITTYQECLDEAMDDMNGYTPEECEKGWGKHYKERLDSLLAVKGE